MDDEETKLVTLPYARIMGSDFWISDTPAEDMVNHVDTLLDGKGTISIKGEVVAWVIVSITVRMTNSEDDSDARMTASARARAEMPVRAGTDVDDAFISCIRESISLAKSQIHVSTALSPMGLVTIPDIDPRRVLETSQGEQESAMEDE